jgi:hypothetical protein
LGKENTFTETQKKLLNHLASEKGNVVLFPNPKNDSDIGQEGAEEIRNIISKNSNFIPRQ